MAEPVRAGPAPLSEAELEEVLTAPTPETIAAAVRLEGDLIVLGAGGKMGPTLAALAKRSVESAGVPHRVVCVSRFSTPGVAEQLTSSGIEAVACDLLEREALARLPDAPNVLYLAGMKFGTSASPELTWALNCYLPAIVAERFREARIVALSTGNVYPLVPVNSGGATEETPADPIGEYAQSCLGRERIFQYTAARHGTRVLLVRLNYATDLRYGVLLDIALRVRRREPVDISMGFLNTIWQGDANAILLRALELCANPPAVLNVAGPETIAVREAALRFAKLLDAPPPVFVGSESELALLSNGGRCHALFGPPRVGLETIVAWTAAWVRRGLPTLDRPTHFEQRNGKF